MNASFPLPEGPSKVVNLARICFLLDILRAALPPLGEEGPLRLSGGAFLLLVSPFPVSSEFRMIRAGILLRTVPPLVLQDSEFPPTIAFHKLFSD